MFHKTTFNKVGMVQNGMFNKTTFNKVRMVQCAVCVYIEGSQVIISPKMLKNVVFISLKIYFYLANSADPP